MGIFEFNVVLALQFIGRESRVLENESAKSRSGEAEQVNERFHAESSLLGSMERFDVFRKVRSLDDTVQRSSGNFEGLAVLQETRRYMYVAVWVICTVSVARWRALSALTPAPTEGLEAREKSP